MSKLLYWLVPKIALVLAVFYGLVDASLEAYNKGFSSVFFIVALIIILLIYDQSSQVLFIISDDKRLYYSRTIRIINCAFMSVISTCFFVLPFVDREFPLNAIFCFVTSVFCLLLVSHDIVILIKARQIRQTDISGFGK